MSRLACGCIVATAQNTAAIRRGVEVGGYVKRFCEQHGIKAVAAVVVRRDSAEMVAKARAEAEADARAVKRRRVDKAKRAQEYDNDPPRCFTCVYFSRGREATNKRAKTIDKCTFGNFPVSYKGLCNEWRNHSGEQLTDGSEKSQSAS